MNKRFEDLRYEMTKRGMEDTLTEVCKKYSDLGMDKYLVNGYLNQGYSLTMPFAKLPLLVYFEDTCREIEEILDHYGRGDTSLDDLHKLTKGLIAEEFYALIEERADRPLLTEKEIQDVQFYYDNVYLNEVGQAANPYDEPVRIADYVFQKEYGDRDELMEYFKDALLNDKTFENWGAVAGSGFVTTYILDDEDVCKISEAAKALYEQKFGNPYLCLKEAFRNAVREYEKGQEERESEETEEDLEK